MPVKNYTKTGAFCRVTFRIPAEAGAGTASLCGDFNDWNRQSHPMKQLKNGGFSITVSLPAGHAYAYRFLLDGTRWENDWEADKYVPNQFGSENSVVVV